MMMMIDVIMILYPLEVTVIPEMQSIMPMASLQVYAYNQIQLLFTRMYNCQQSALEFYLNDHGFYNSVLLYFPDQV